MQIFHYCFCSTAVGLCIAPDNSNHLCFYCGSTFRCNTAYYHIVQWHFSWNFKCFLCLCLHSHIKNTFTTLHVNWHHTLKLFFLSRQINSLTFGSWVSIDTLTNIPIQFSPAHNTHTQPSPALSLQLKVWLLSAQPDTSAGTSTASPSNVTTNFQSVYIVHNYKTSLAY